jgi:hypothetical protein
VDLNLLRRVLAEYQDMRGLRLTRPQAARLWSLSDAECEAVLGALVATGHLYHDEDGQFALRPQNPTAPARPWRDAQRRPRAMVA